MLLDLGSTHNFIILRVAIQDNYFIYSPNNFEVMIINEGKISYKRKYRNVRLNMGDNQLQSDMYVLPLGGFDVILGAQ